MKYNLTVILFMIYTFCILTSHKDTMIFFYVEDCTLSVKDQIVNIFALQAMCSMSQLFNSVIIAPKLSETIYK